MMFLRGPRRGRTSDDGALRARRILAWLLLLMAASGLAAGSLAFRSLVMDLAVSSAEDTVVLAVNSVVKEILGSGSFDGASLVELQKDADGRITAVTTNVAAVNTLASEVLERAVARTAEDRITVKIPLGNLFGSTLLLGKGPVSPVKISMLSASSAGFRSELVSAGINQTRHQILLELNVAVSLLMPWRTVGTQVETEILVSETVIVGDVPQSYMNWVE